MHVLKLQPWGGWWNLPTSRLPALQARDGARPAFPIPVPQTKWWLQSCCLGSGPSGLCCLAFLPEVVMMQLLHSETIHGSPWVLAKVLRHRASSFI